MPNMRLAPMDVKNLIGYLSSESNRVQMQRARERRARSQGASMAVAAVYNASTVHSGHAQLATSDGHAQHDHAYAGDAPSGDAPSGDAVAIMNAWVREAHPEAAVNAGYMTLVNVGSEDVTLVELESPAFEKVEIHEMAMADGLMKMRELAEVVVAAGGQARFEPGGTHLMLMGPRRHLGAGETVDLTLTFRSGMKQTVSVRVADR